MVAKTVILQAEQKRERGRRKDRRRNLPSAPLLFLDRLRTSKRTFNLELRNRPNRALMIMTMERANVDIFADFSIRRSSEGKCDATGVIERAASPVLLLVLATAAGWDPPPH